MAKRRKPLYGSVEWVAAQAKEAGTTYGRYVAEMEPPAPDESKPELTPEEKEARQKATAQLEALRRRQAEAQRRQGQRQLLTETLVRTRQSKGLSREEVAGALGVHKVSVKNWEQAKSRPREQYLVALSRLYGLELKELERLFEAAKKDGGAGASTPEQAREQKRAKKRGEALRKARIKAGLTPMAAAERLRVTTTAIHQWETGKSRPGMQSQFKISRGYEIDMDELQKLLA